MPWVIEDLAGVKDSSNVTFTVTYTPMKPTLAVVHRGRRLRPVAVTPQPGQYEYGINLLEIVLGRAPDSGDDLWTRYYTEEGGEGLLGGEFMAMGALGGTLQNGGGGYGGGGPYGIEG